MSYIKRHYVEMSVYLRLDCFMQGDEIHPDILKYSKLFLQTQRICERINCMRDPSRKERYRWALWNAIDNLDWPPEPLWTVMAENGLIRRINMEAD